MNQKNLLICGMAAAVILTSVDARASYNSVLRKWTKDGRSFAANTMDARLIWHATLLSDELVDAQQRLAQKRKVTLPSQDLTGVNFFLKFYTHKALNNFSLDDGSTWKIFLVGSNGQEVPAIKIDSVTITPVESTLYPHMDRWSKAYIVKFPETDLGTGPKLVLRSIVAESVLEWKIER